jgi:phycocyanobilin lyase beta subunit
MPNSSKSLQALIEAVDAADSAVRLTEAVQELADACLEAPLLEAIPTFIAALGYNNPGAAVAAVEGLIHLGESAVAALLNELDQQNYTARAWAIRALAGIGDPRGLTTLLGAATADFAMSVRRAAARGLGKLHWAAFPASELEIAQAEALDALLFVCEDEEWIVRYAAITGLEALALAIWETHPDWRPPLMAKLAALATQDPVAAVRARVLLAQRQIQSSLGLAQLSEATVPEAIADWRLTIERIYRRKSQDRPLAEGDPRRFRAIAAQMTPAQSQQT